MKNNFTLGIQATVEPNITFLTNSSKEAMRIDKNGVKVNPDFPMDEAAQYVIKALDEHIKGLIHAERERLASIIKAAEGVLEWTELGYTQPVRDKFEVGRMVRVRLHALADLHEAIRNRGNT
jgi:hypothetical protein